MATQIQMGTLTSNVTVIDEDELLSPAQLDKLSEQILARLEQKLKVAEQRADDQAIGRSNSTRR